MDDEQLEAILSSALLPGAEDLLKKLGLEVAIRPSVGARPDDTALAEAAERIQKAKDKTVELQKHDEVQRLGAAVAHEVRNAMTGVIGLAQLAQKNTDGEVRELLAVIEAESRRSVQVLSDFMRPQASRRAPQQIDLTALVDSVSVVMAHTLRKRRIQVAIHHGERVPAARGRDGEIRQVLMNLLINAMHALPYGGTVQLRTERVSTGHDGAEWVDVVVADSGDGVPAELRDKIFELGWTSKPEGVGAGLGLALSASIAKAHGGSLTLDPRGEDPGGERPAGEDPARKRGAVFRLRLPVWDITPAG